ncbi:MAG: hypothetical protein KKI08_10640, partial [Armatimonadetes bacterium]|nr:hypothetical protein [Armatimonadota bacterium]
GAFEGFMADSASTDAEILTLRTAMYATFFVGDTVGMDTVLRVDMFKFRTSEGVEVNWPITMVVPTSWVVGVKNATGSLTYTPRDTTAVPAMMGWLAAREPTGPLMIT